tara:strand:- start:2555 stop:2779 length:225 start_codon:yes stop_codon:yes gene_type:complete
MRNNATFIDKEQRKNLNKIDSWLREDTLEINEEIVLRVRELITLIETRGHYYESEAEVLNMIGEEYNNWKRKNR